MHRQGRRDNFAQPWELVALKTEEIGRRVNLNENVFPVNIVLQLLLQYDLELTEPEKAWTTSCYWFVMQQGLNVRLTERSPAN